MMQSRGYKSGQHSVDDGLGSTGMTVIERGGGGDGGDERGRLYSQLHLPLETAGITRGELASATGPGGDRSNMAESQS